MRHCYLLPDKGDSCVGGVMGYGEDYGLEIGPGLNFDVEMMSLAAHIDEIKEYLKDSTPMGQLLLASITRTAEDLLGQRSG